MKDKFYSIQKLSPGLSQIGENKFLPEKKGTASHSSAIRKNSVTDSVVLDLYLYSLLLCTFPRHKDKTLHLIAFLPCQAPRSKQPDKQQSPAAAPTLHITSGNQTRWTLQKNCLDSSVLFRKKENT